MSRSYRQPFYVDGYGSKWKAKSKRQANRRVRAADTADGGAYKKVTNSWDICDYRFKDASGKAGRK